MRTNTMLWHPFLLLFRKRLIATAVLSLLAPLAAVLSGRVPSLVGINLLLCIPIGTCLGWTGAKNGAAETRFLFTRPIARLAVLLRPLTVASFAIAIFPLPTFLLRFGWLWLLPPARSQLVGLHPSPLHVLATIASAYLVPVSGGLSVYTVLMSPRWLTFSRKWRRSLIMFALFLFALPFVFSILWAPRGVPDDLQLTLRIVWFFAFAAGALYCCWRVIDELPAESDDRSVKELIRAARAAK